MNHNIQTRRNFLRTLASASAATALGIYAPGMLGHASAAGIVSASATSPAIICPRVANPAFVQPGGTFTVEVRGDRGLDAGGWSATLRNDLRVSWPCRVEQAKYGDVNTGRESGWVLTIRAPQGVAPELCHLLLEHRSAGSLKAEQAVSVVPDLEAPFYALQITDEHMTRELQSGIPQAEDRKTGYRTAQLVTWGTQVVNLINPRIVVNSGDQVTRFYKDGRENTMIKNIYGCYLKAKRGYRVPTMMILGNHDVPEEADPTAAWADWEAQAGQRYYTIRMGSLAIFGHDYTDPAAKRWTSDAYAAMWKNDEIKGRLFVQHYTDWNAVSLPKDTPATLMLIGHIHNHAVVKREPFPILMSIAAHRYNRSGFVAFERNSQGRWATKAADKWTSGSYLELLGTDGTPEVWVNYDTANDGRASSNRAIVSNTLRQSFADGRVRFLMQAGSYTVKGGDVLASYTYLNESGKVCQAVDVRVNILAKGATIVTITPGSDTKAVAPQDSASSREPVAVDSDGIPTDILPTYSQPKKPAPLTDPGSDTGGGSGDDGGGSGDDGGGSGDDGGGSGDDGGSGGGSTTAGTTHQIWLPTVSAPASN